MFPVLFVVLISLIQQDSLDFYIQRGLDASYCEDYDSAKFYINKAIEIDTNNPLGYFAYTGLFRIYTSDFVTDSLLDSFFYYADKTVEKANLRIKKNKNDGWGYFFLGAINMYISSLYVEKGNYLKSLSFAEKSVNEIRLCLARNPDLYDAYLVMGSYEYLKGSFPLWSAYKDKGIEKIRIASRMSTYSRHMAKNILTILLQREGRYDESLKVAKELVDAFPQSRTFRWALCKAYLAKGEWDEAIESYKYLLQNIMKEQPDNSYNIIQVELSLANAYYNKGEFDKAIELCNDIFNRDSSDKKVRKMIKEAKEIYKNALRNH